MKKMALFLALIALIALFLLGFETTRTLDLAADGIRSLEVTAGAGSLTITGREGLASIEVRAEIVVSDVDDRDREDDIKRHVDLELRRSGDRAILVSRLRESGFFSFHRDARIDLTVTVPKAMALEIEDGSGSLAVENIAAAVRIDDGSGSITVRGLEGSLEIEDGSGEIDVQDVAGDVSLEDGSGGISLRRVGGNITVSDGSGGIDVDDVGKDVRLTRTGSGGVDVTNVKGRVIR
jgi:DUF4097 and DUF4098 domain-containing protein YvlB